MATIKVNLNIWDKASEDEKAEVLYHLKKHNVLKEEDEIVGDPDTKAPDANTPLYSATFGDVMLEKGMKWNPLRDICKAACDVAAATATAACTASGPGLAACLIAIAAARSACRDAC